MRLPLLPLAIALELAAFMPAAAQTPIDVLKSCSSTKSALVILTFPWRTSALTRARRRPTAITWSSGRPQPPEGKGSSGVCVVDPSFYVLRFEATSGPQPGNAPVKVSPEDALRTCQDKAAEGPHSHGRHHGRAGQGSGGW